jgi:hypothetical protein
VANLSEIEIAINQRVVKIFDDYYSSLKSGKKIFSEKFGLDTSNFSRYLSFERPFPVEALVKIAKDHSVSLDYLLAGKESLSILTSDPPAAYKKQTEIITIAVDSSGNEYIPIHSYKAAASVLTQQEQVWFSHCAG